VPGINATSIGLAGLIRLITDVPFLTPNKAYSLPNGSTYPQISLFPAEECPFNEPINSTLVCEKMLSADKKDRTAISLCIRDLGN
jgi:hypothetical protein